MRIAIPATPNEGSRTSVFGPILRLRARSWGQRTDLMPRNPDRPWVTPLRVISTAVLVSALLTMLVSMTVLFNNEPSGPTGVTMRRAMFGDPVLARENRLSQQQLAWIPVAAFGVAFGVRVAGDRKQRQTEAEKARLGIFPPLRGFR